MSRWWSNNSRGLGHYLATGVRAVQWRALSLTHPSTLRHAQEQVVRLITVVAGH
jgi:hypothetical protein